MTPPVRVGFLGAGLIATYHSKSLRRSGADAVRAGVFDPVPERAAAFAAASGHTVCASEDEVIAGCDAVYICTWTSEHPRQLAKAVAAGRHVFCEKPLATTLAAAEEMATLALDAGIVNQVGLVLRRSPAFLMAAALITDPAAGRLMSVVIRDDQFIPIQGHYSSTWRADRNLVGTGTLLEHSIHDVDMIHMLGGPIERVSAHTANFHGHDGIEDVATATFRFRSGALGTMNSVWHDNLARPSLRRVELFAERRHVVVDGDDWFGPVSWTDHDGATGSLADESLAERVESLHDTGANPDGAFIRAVQLGEPATPDLSTAVAAHRVVEAMYVSAAQDGTTVAVDR
ncbi:MAG: Gfo/Idh/MocA family oxidoreductase [Ilumatobacteraceae bacterium]